MRTVVLGPPPPELEALIARRRQSGLDRFDEVWGGEYHMAPMAHSSHGWLDDQLAVLLRPLARAAGLVGTGAPASRLLGPGSAGLADRIDWPDPD